MTFLFTDIEGAIRLWQATSDAMTVALRRHDELVKRAIDSHRGRVFATGGDGLAGCSSGVPLGYCSQPLRPKAALPRRTPKAPRR